MEVNGVLDEVSRIFDNEVYAQDEKLEKLSSLKYHCENWLKKEFKRTVSVLTDEDALGVYLCDFSKLQFPRSQEQRSSNHIPLR